MAKQLLNLITDVVTTLDTSIGELTPIVDTQMVNSAEGLWLDFLADLVGCRPRVSGINNSSTITDFNFRKMILAKISINNGGATIENIANTIRYVVFLNDDNDWDAVKDRYVDITVENAKIFVNAPEVKYSQLSTIREFMPIGVGLLFHYIPDNSFVVSDPNHTPPYPINTGGCGTLNDLTIGGKLSYLIS